MDRAQGTGPGDRMVEGRAGLAMEEGGGEGGGGGSRGERDGEEGRLLQ